MTNGSPGMEASVCCSRGMELDSERDVHHSNGHILISQAELSIPEEWRLGSKRDVYISQPPISTPRRVAFVSIPHDTKILPC